MKSPPYIHRTAMSLALIAAGIASPKNPAGMTRMSGWSVDRPAKRT